MKYVQNMITVCFVSVNSFLTETEGTNECYTKPPSEIVRNENVEKINKIKNMWGCPSWITDAIPNNGRRTFLRNPFCKKLGLRRKGSNLLKKDVPRTKLFFEDDTIRKDKNLLHEFNVIQYYLIFQCSHPSIFLYENLRKINHIRLMVKTIVETENNKSQSNLKKFLSKERICKALNKIKPYFVGVIKYFYESKRKINYKWNKIDIGLFFEAIEHLVRRPDVVGNQFLFFMKNKKLEGCREMATKFVDSLLMRNNYEMHLYMIYFYKNSGKIYDGTKDIKNPENFLNFLDSEEYSVFYTLSILGAIL